MKFGGSIDLNGRNPRSNLQTLVNVYIHKQYDMVKKSNYTYFMFRVKNV